MARDSLEGLLAWMKEGSVMWDWDVICALDGRMMNLGLQHDHFIRLSQGSDLGSFTGSVNIPETNLSLFMTDFRFEAPQLSYENASLQSRRTDLSLAVVGGIEALVETTLGVAQIQSLSAFDPMGNAQVKITKVPLGAEAGDVSLDLVDGEEVLAGWLGTPNEQRETGKLLRAWMAGLASNQRLHTLATLPSTGHLLMNTHSIDVRTQHDGTPALPPGVLDENGALVLFAKMVEGRSGSYPGDDAGFKFLIPAKNAQNSSSATLLFSKPLIHRAAYASALLQLLEEGGEFQHVTDANGVLVKMIAKGGVLPVAAGNYQSDEYEFESEAASLPAFGGAPLTVEFHENQVIQHWQNRFSLSFKYRPAGGSTWKPHTGVFNIDLRHVFDLYAGEEATSAIEGELYTPYDHIQEVSVESGLPELPPEALEQIKAFVANTVKGALLEKLSNSLGVTAPDAFLEDVKTVGAGSFQPSHVALPFEQVFFGSASGASFSIVEQGSLVPAGQYLQLTTQPVPQGPVRWTLEALPGNDADPGDLDEATGRYRAPPAHAMTEPFIRVLAIASDTSTGERAATLITALANPISINPLIQKCYYNERVRLSAGQFDGTAVRASIKDPVPGESGRLEDSSEPGGHLTYIAGPQVANKSYVLDEIVVTGTQGNDTASAYVMAIQKDPLVTVKPEEDANLPEGQIKLQAIFDGEPIEGAWSIRVGPGTMQQDGIYIDDPAAKELFVLIDVKVQVIGRSFDGHIILPRSLSRFAPVIKALSK